MRYIHIIILLIPTFLATNGYCTGRIAKADTVKTIFIENQNYWQAVNPVMFLDTLRKYPGYQFVISAEPPRSWFQSKFKKIILNSLKSTVKCGMALSVHEDNVHVTANSNIHIEAMKIINGITNKKYP